LAFLEITQDSQVALSIKLHEPAQEIKKNADTSLEVKCRRDPRLNIVKIKNYGEKWQRKRESTSMI
jgi:hypothetical protein